MQSFLSFSHSKSSIMFCTVPGTLFSQKVRGQTVTRLRLMLCPWGGAGKRWGVASSLWGCVYMRECHKLACPLVWFSGLISHSQNRLTFVEMVLLCLPWAPKGSFLEGENRAKFGPGYCHMVGMRLNPSCPKTGKTKTAKRIETDASIISQVLIVRNRKSDTVH